ncbi:helix-turn-helix transcriptional regulator [Chamaesiphon sp. GL140_3_metabinner_50]|uniref:helix-turn-helix domain-containing protein n=1 Tax=Chamaesiphon sp. GL140_3_metabinner_50 TaxID=2970812 RepID=UPI0025E6B307|nr:helix-turn-helix transcriptional regulator [Chamaesiphon sp. GL140_3_metabinner_50]
MELSIAQTAHLHLGIQQLYTLQNLDTFGVNALTIVDRLVPGDLPEFHLTNLRTRQISSSFLPDFLGFTPAMEKVMQQHFGEHPIAQQMPLTLDGVHKISDFITRQKLHSLEGLYQQFLRLLDTEDQMVFFLPNINAVNSLEPIQIDPILVGFSMHRQWGKFTERDRLVLSLLRPHLSQAYNNAQQYHQLQQDRDRVQQYLHDLGAIVLDSEGRIQSIAPQASTWLSSYFTTSTCSARLPDHLWSWVKYRVSCLSDAIDLKTCLSLRIQQDGRELTIRLVIEPLGRYILILEEQIRCSLNSLAFLGLSQRETEVLALVIQGKDNKAIASQLSVHASTIRKHLENIYAKLNVRSRTEAIAKVLDKLGFLHSLQLSR